MGRVTYEPIRYGFRPLANTNPFAATMLNGLGEPLGDMVSDQAIVTYQGRWTSTYFQGATDVISKVTQALASQGLLVRNSSSDATGFGQTTIIGMTVHPAPFNVTLQIQIDNGLGFGSVDDVISIIRHYVYAVTGEFPFADSIPSVQNAVTGESESTGQPNVQGAPAVSGDFTNWLQSNALLIGGIVIAATVLPSIIRKL